MSEADRPRSLDTRHVDIEQTQLIRHRISELTELSRDKASAERSRTIRVQKSKSFPVTNAATEASRGELSLVEHATGYVNDTHQLRTCCRILQPNNR